MGSSGEESDQEVLYHQLATEEIEEEVEEEKRRIFRARIHHNSIMELSIHNRRLFFICLAVIEAFGILAVILTFHWAINIKGGVTYVENKGIPFNWHPILMTISLIFLYGNGALIYRVIPPRSESHKLRLKIGHALTMILAFVLMVIGLQAAFDSHNLARNKENQLAPKPNMYTLHSWVGILAATLFGCQWMLGFLAFLFPKFSADLRALVLPIHQYLGSAILVLAAAAALLGHLEKAIWSNKQYNEYNPEAIIVNITGILIVLFVMGVTFILSKFSTEQPNKER